MTGVQDYWSGWKTARRYRMVAALVWIVVLGACIPPGAAVEPLAEEWNMTYHLGTFTHILAIEEAHDGTYLLGGLGYEEGGEHASLTRTDAAGYPVWTKFFPGDYVSAVRELPDGGAMLGVYEASVTFEQTADRQNATGRSWVIRTDNAGDPVWNREVPDFRISGLEITGTGEYLVSGWTWSDGAPVTSQLKFYDTSGQEIRSVPVEGFAIRDIAGMEDGGFVVVGTSTPFKDDITDGFIVRLDSEGSEQWQAVHPASSISTVAPVPGGGVLVGGIEFKAAPDFGANFFEQRSWVASVDPEGGTAWNRTVPGRAILAIASHHPSEYLLAGLWGDFGQVITIDGEGNVLASTVYREGPGKLNAAIPVADGGYAVAGWTRASGDMEGQVIRYSASSPQTPGPGQTSTPGFGIWIALAGLSAVCFLRLLTRS